MAIPLQLVMRVQPSPYAECRDCHSHKVLVDHVNVGVEVTGFEVRFPCCARAHTHTHTHTMGYILALSFEKVELCKSSILTVFLAK